MSVGRLIVSLIVGFVVVQVIVMVTNGIGGVIFHSLPDPETGKIGPDANSDGLCLWNMAWYLPACAVGAFIAVKIGRAAPWRPVIGMVVLIVGLGVPYAIFAPPMYREMGADIPGWCLWVLPLSGSLGVLLGGSLGARTKSR